MLTIGAVFMITGGDPYTAFASRFLWRNQYYTVNGNIFKDGKKVNLRGVNWFGAETEINVPHGLWSRGMDDMMDQIKSLGFNAVRIPFCPDTLRGVKAGGYIDPVTNPDLLGKNSLEVLDIMLNKLNQRQMYILLDHHRINCKEKITPLWYTDNYSEDQWIKDLQFVAKRYENLEYLVGIDLKNEPHGEAQWGGDKPESNWKKAAEKAGKAVLDTNNKVLVFVNGIGSSWHPDPRCQTGYGAYWGNNLKGVKCSPINNRYIPRHKMVFSPHVYGPDVADQDYFNAPNFPNNLPAVWDDHFGFLRDNGMMVIPGEFGGRYITNSKDKVVMDKLIDYFIQKRICNWFYWSWNPNSGDTGGILGRGNNQDDWKTVNQDKVEALKRLSSECK
jgi:endoglucanase